jgi:hypothetical protein
MIIFSSLTTRPNKSVFPLPNLSRKVKCLWVRPGASPIGECFKGLLFWQALNVLANIRLGGKALLEQKTLKNENNYWNLRITV